MSAEDPHAWGRARSAATHGGERRDVPGLAACRRRRDDVHVARRGEADRSLPRRGGRRGEAPRDAALRDLTELEEPLAAARPSATVPGPRPEPVRDAGVGVRGGADMSGRTFVADVGGTPWTRHAPYSTGPLALSSTPRIPKKNHAPDLAGGGAADGRLATTYFRTQSGHYHRRARLNGRVRNGIGCFPRTMVTSEIAV